MQPNAFFPPARVHVKHNLPALTITIHRFTHSSGAVYLAWKSRCLFQRIKEHRLDWFNKGSNQTTFSAIARIGIIDRNAVWQPQMSWLFGYQIQHIWSHYVVTLAGYWSLSNWNYEPNRQSKNVNNDAEHYISRALLEHWNFQDHLLFQHTMRVRSSSPTNASNIKEIK